MQRIPIPPPATGLRLDDSGNLQEMTDEEKKRHGLELSLPSMDEPNRKIHNLLTLLGFKLVSFMDTDSDGRIGLRNIYQRQTPQTNILVDCNFETVTVAHGSPAINRTYATIPRDDTVLRLEQAIHWASIEQIERAKGDYKVTVRQSGQVVPFRLTKKQLERYEEATKRGWLLEKPNQYALEHAFTEWSRNQNRARVSVRRTSKRFASIKIDFETSSRKLSPDGVEQLRIIAFWYRERKQMEDTRQMTGDTLTMIDGIPVEHVESLADAVVALVNRPQLLTNQ